MTTSYQHLLNVRAQQVPMIHLKNASLNTDTRQSIQEGLVHMEKIQTIQLYYSEEDAALDGYYYVDPKHKHGQLEPLFSPRMIMTDENGDQMWIHCANCGYSGSGPSSAKRILRRLPDTGVKAVPALSEEQLESINEYRHITFQRSGEAWKLSLEDSHMEPSVRLNKETKAPPQAKMYRYKDNMVLLQGQESSYSEHDNNGSAKATIKEYATFIPNPVAFTFYNDEESALEQGHVYPHPVNSHYPAIYPLIIHDKSGRELWLQPYVEKDQSFADQMVVKELLESMGFDLLSYQKKVEPVNFLRLLIPRKEQEQDPVRVIKGQMNIKS